MRRSSFFSFCIAALVCVGAPGRAFAVDGDSIIRTVAGGGVGDGGPATNVAISNPYTVATDSAGNLYISDGPRIRKVDIHGVITTVAGNGTRGYSGDGGLATNAQISTPTNLAADNAGNLYIADTGNNRVRKVDVNGIISTIAGDGDPGFSGDGGPATNAELDAPLAVAIDSAGDIYIVDSENERIRKVDTNGIIETIAGNGDGNELEDGVPAVDANLRQPIDIALDASGDLYIASFSKPYIRKVDASGIISTLYDGGCGFATCPPGLSFGGIGVDAQGNVYAPATFCCGILKIDTNGNTTPVAGYGAPGFSGDGGPAVNAELNRPADVAVDGAGRVYIADSRNNRIRVVDTNGVIDTVAGNGTDDVSGDGGPATNAQIYSPTGMAVDAAGDIYIAEFWNQDIRKVDTSGIISSVYSINIYGGSGFSTIIPGIPIPTVVGADNLGNSYVADTLGNRILKIDANGGVTTVAGTGTQGYSGDGGPATSAELDYPYDVAADADGNLYIADYFNARIRKVDTSGVISTVAGNGKGGVAGDGGPATDANIVAPNICVDAAGNLYFADALDDRVRKITTDGIITTVAGNGVRGYSGDGGAAVDAELAFPSGVAADSKGNVYIADAFNHRLRKVDTTGVITTLAGNGTSTNSGDGGPAADAALAGPGDVAVDGADNVYIAVANRIREIVNASATAGIDPDQHGLTGSWYNPATSGQGFEIEVYPDLVKPGQGLLFGGWFTYDVDASGGRRWYSLSGNVNSATPVANLQIGIAQNGNLDAPPVVGAQAVGTAQIVFSDCTHATLDYQFSDGSGRQGSIPLLRLTPNVTCSDSGNSGQDASTYLLSGSWYNPDTSGQGFVFDFSPSINNVFAAWYTYKVNGQQVPGTASQDWYTLQSGQFQPGMSSLSNIPIVQTTGGIFDNPTATSTSQVGSADIAFSSCDTMTLTYRFTSGDNNGRNGTIHLRRTGPTPQGCSL